MIESLRRSFVRTTMISAALVLAILMGAVNLINYLERRDSDNEILQYLAENGGRFPSAGKGGRGRHFTAETPYETRYFSVFLDTEGDLVYADTSQIAAVTLPEAAETAQALFAAGGVSGRADGYRYTTVWHKEGVLYIFLDCSRNDDAAAAFLLNSGIVTVLGLLVLWGISRALSPRAIRPVAESYEKQKSFITNAGHELKTPLAVIGSCTDVIELESGESKWTRSIRDQVDRMAALTQELVALARMDESTALTLTETDVSAVVAEALAPFAPMAEQRGLVFETEIEPDILAASNAEALRKLCGILADNAVKYAAEGGRVSFTLERQGGHVVLRAENPSEGLVPGSQEKLFDRFYRGDESRSSDTPGYGLGLSLARSLTEALGGRIRADSPDGRSIVFTARLD